MIRNAAFPAPYFYCYLAILCWSPLPLGSNRDWSISLLSALSMMLAGAMLVYSFWYGKKSLVVLSNFRLPLLLFSIALLWITFQILPLPVGMLELLSNKAASLKGDIPGVSSAISLEPGVSYKLALFSWSLWLYFCISLVIIDTQSRAKTALIVLVLSGVCQALYGSFMTLSKIEYGFLVPKNAYLGVATGSFVNRNHLAGYLEMCLALGIGLLVSTLNDQNQGGWRNQLKRGIDTMLGPKLRLRLYLALMVIGLVLTRSRMGNTAFFSSLIVSGLLLMILQKRLHKGALILFTSLILVDMLIVGQWFGFEKLAERLESTTAEAETRDEVVRDGMVMLQDYSLTGTGLGTFYNGYPQYRAKDVSGYYDHAHNDFLEFGITLGIPGLMLLGALVMSGLYTSIRAMYQRRDRFAKGIAFAGCMGILSLLLHSLTDFNLHIPANALLFVVVLALAHIAKQLPSARRSNKDIRKTIGNS